MSHLLAFLAGAFACFAWIMYLAFGPVRLWWKTTPDEPDPGGGWQA